MKLKLAELEADAPIQNNSKFDSIGSRAGAASFSANNLKKTTPRLGIRFRCISEWPAAAHLLDPVRFWQKFGRRMIQEPPLGWTCSNLVKFISRAGNGNCLLDRPDNTMVRENPRRLPGEDYSVNKQCELVFGKGSEVCAHMVGDGKSHIFVRIHAVVTKSHYSIYSCYLAVCIFIRQRKERLLLWKWNIEAAKKPLHWYWDTPLFPNEACFIEFYIFRSAMRVLLNEMLRYSNLIIN